MRRVLLAVVLLAVLVGVVGCNGVYLSAEYSQLLDETGALSAMTAERAKAGALDPNQMIEALTVQAEVWRKFQDARDGVSQGGGE